MEPTEGYEVGLLRYLISEVQDWLCRTQQHEIAYTITLDSSHLYVYHNEPLSVCCITTHTDGCCGACVTYAFQSGLSRSRSCCAGACLTMAVLRGCEYVFVCRGSAEKSRAGLRQVPLIFAQPQGWLWWQTLLSCSRAPGPGKCTTGPAHSPASTLWGLKRTSHSYCCRWSTRPFPPALFACCPASESDPLQSLRFSESPCLACCG